MNNLSDIINLPSLQNRNITININPNINVYNSENRPSDTLSGRINQLNSFNNLSSRRVSPNIISRRIRPNTTSTRIYPTYESTRIPNYTRSTTLRPDTTSSRIHPNTTSRRFYPPNCLVYVFLHPLE